MLKTQLANCQVGKPTIDFFKMSAYNLDKMHWQQSLLNSKSNEITTCSNHEIAPIKLELTKVESL